MQCPVDTFSPQLNCGKKMRKCDDLNKTKCYNAINKTGEVYIMFAIELYRVYVENSIKNATTDEKRRRLNFEIGKTRSIIEGIDNLFEGDQSIFDKKDTSIYTLIKQEIVSNLLKGNPLPHLESSKFLLNGILNEMQQILSEIKANPIAA